jgi:hypothetical protein
MMSKNSAEFRRANRQKSYKSIQRDEYVQRAHEFAARGESLSKSLSEQDIIKIRINRKGNTMAELGEMFGVHKNTIYKIQHRITWSHVR